MKITTYIISIIALLILIFNISKINFEAPLEGDSHTAVVTSIAAGCAILLVSTIRISLKIRDMIKKIQSLDIKK